MQNFCILAAHSIRMAVEESLLSFVTSSNILIIPSWEKCYCEYTHFITRDENVEKRYL
jgi:hypothetical protein